MGNDEKGMKMRKRIEKVAIINIPIDSYFDDRKFPCLGISSIATNLIDNGFSCEYIDGDISDLSKSEIINRLSRCDCVGMSFTAPGYKNALYFAREVKKVKDIPIVLGGHFATFYHEKILAENECFDAIIRGEGESRFVKYCKYYNEGIPLNCIEGISIKNKDDGKMWTSDVIYYEHDLNDLKSPIRFELFKYYSMSGGIVPFSTSRGCPYGCNYCSATAFRNKWAGRTPEKVSDEIYDVYKICGDLTIAFIDDNFYMDPKRAISIIAKSENKCGKKFDFIFATRADQIINGGFDNLIRLKNYGCIEIELGVENGSPEVLNRLGKGLEPEDSLKAINMITEAGIKPVVDFIMFDPETTLNDLKDNIAFLKTANLWGYDSPLIYDRVIAFPGTLFELIHKKQFAEDYSPIPDGYFLCDNVKNIYKHLQKFRNEYQLRINELLKMIREKPHNDWLYEYRWLKILPYFIFERLVMSERNIDIEYDTIVHELEIEKNISIFEGKILK